MDAFKLQQGVPALSILLAAGHSVKSVQSARDGLAEVLHDSPDVLLLNLVMPKISGTSFLEIIRSNLRLETLPVVVYTDPVDGPTIDRVRAMRVNHVLVKTRATAEEFGNAIQNAVEASRKSA